jgi:putative tricarboxylic transport membrane protein
MGPGYFPLALVFILFGLSLVLIVQSFMGESRDEEPSEAIATSRYGGLRAAAAILSAAVIFGLLIRPAGLAPSVFLGVIIGSLGMPNYSWRTALLLALALAFLCCLVFSVLLGLRIPIFGPVFGF